MRTIRDMPTGDPGSAAAPPRRQPGGPAKGDRRRQAIVDAVEHLLQTRSIGELSVEDIAAEAGISRSGFYFYFESKYAALADALSDVADGMERAADDFFGDTGREPRDYVNEALTGVSRMWRQHSDLMVAVVDAAHSDTGARALWDAWQARFVEGISRAIENERASGRTQADGVGTEELSKALLAMNVGTYYDLARTRASDEEAERAVAALATVWLSAVWGIT
jgi:TetR/AcrR family transcriptional regulator, ethionamide resistance regulator